ncbi:hypothetical protein [uncultured Stenotrophomonas sp.]|uniref:hypothetical protein n=1 Tax=uncultured Stenotrophomonas sp. TaxID=165438 RepID=UPI0025F7F2C2|nr:hypothetical protein [uncultured Stenotrophomonas sp.]
MSDSQIHALYLLACLVTCGIPFALAAYGFIKVVDARLGKLPPRVHVSTLGPRSPTRRQRKFYWRAMRRNPESLTFTLPAQAPRWWALVGAVLFITIIAVWAWLMPNPARFNVMVRNTFGYTATVAEVRIVRPQHGELLRRWAPVVVRSAHYIAIPRYSRGPMSYITGYDTDILPAQIRQQGDALQVAMPNATDPAVLRRELAKASGLPERDIHMQQRTLAPWREDGWEPWPMEEDGSTR